MERIWTKNKKVNSAIAARVFVGMSGGVDSSVAAYLLRKQGYDVVGVFMHSFNLDGCEERDAEDARRVAEKLDIPFYVMDFEKEYKKYVVEYMVRGYAAGLTPNPDVMCNKEIKFGFFLKKALELGADFVATGHYVRLRRTSRKYSVVSRKRNARSLPTTYYQLLTACDTAKDQSYFLWTLTQEQLARCLFPIGGYQKPKVRAMAKQAGLSTASKKDSQGICFLGKVTIADFLKEYIPAQKGMVVNEKGEAIGEHDGAQFYTIGQRHGFDVRSKTSEAKPYYVADKNIAENKIIAVEGDNNAALFRKEVQLANVNFIRPIISLIRANKGYKDIKADVWARVRYRQPLAKAKLIQDESGIKLIFEKPQKFVASGQSAVFYSSQGEMLGGGIIAN